MTLAHRLRSLPRRVTSSPWKNCEHVRGYGVFSLPFSSGHLLGLRVFPESDFAPYVSVWHQTPSGDWSIYNDGPSLKTTCPRWWGPALQHASLTSIEVTWTGPAALSITMKQPSLEWDLSLYEPPLLRAANAISRRLPLWTWRSRSLLRVREWMTRRLANLGDLRFQFTTPSGHDATLMPEELLFVRTSSAQWNGQELGRPVRRSNTPTIGDVALPKVPTFVIGQAHAKILNRNEYERTKASVQVESTAIRSVPQ